MIKKIQRMPAYKINHVQVHATAGKFWASTVIEIPIESDKFQYKPSFEKILERSDLWNLLHTYPSKKKVDFVIDPIFPDSGFSRLYYKVRRIASRSGIWIEKVELSKVYTVHSQPPTDETTTVQMVYLTLCANDDKILEDFLSRKYKIQPRMVTLRVGDVSAAKLITFDAFSDKNVANNERQINHNGKEIHKNE